MWVRRLLPVVPLFLVCTPSASGQLESLPKPGEIFDESRLGEFFKVNASILPSDASTDDLRITQDVRARTVAIFFDFRDCPPNTN